MTVQEHFGNTTLQKSKNLGKIHCCVHNFLVENLAKFSKTDFAWLARAKKESA